jgi:transposase
MRKIREILRLKYSCGCSLREISSSCGIGRGTVSDYLQRARAAGLGWPLPGDLTDTALEHQLFPSSTPRVNKPLFHPDFQKVYQELQSRKHVTLALLWQECNRPIKSIFSSCARGGILVAS